MARCEAGNVFGADCTSTWMPSLSSSSAEAASYACENKPAVVSPQEQAVVH
jgi:hypothetical protein